ncbi:MAG: putative PEP-binding protein [Oculatellaceae cyanobacterium bins.114]|nr:putative PEP-binding protein [Oculatellaceae cyanobacterium bins.114]
MDDFYWLDQIRPAHRSWVGDKAFHLGLFSQRGYPVIPGVVVSAPAFRTFLETIQWLDPLFADLPNSSLHIDVDNPRQLQAIAQQIRQGIIDTPIAEAWLTTFRSVMETWQAKAVILRPSISVRSDVVVRMGAITGLLQSQVCCAEPEAIAQGLRQVWSELFQAKSLLYWQRLGIQLQQVNLAVLIQPIRPAIASGTLSSDATGVEVQSIWGLGKALVEGIVAADVYQTDLQTGALRLSRLGTKRYAYGVESIDPISVMDGAALSVSRSEECLKIYPVSATYQNQATLSDRQLQHLLQVAQRLVQDWGQPIGLEWVFCQPTVGSEPVLYLTQINPCPLQKHPSTTPVNTSSLARAIAPLQEELLSQKHLTPHVSPTELGGLAASGGQVLAQAWVVDNEQPLTSIPASTVLIASHIQPQWATILKHCAAIVTQQGGVTSHGAILAREIGIPAVVGVIDVMNQIQSGDFVFVDGNRGKVYRVNALDVATFAIPTPSISTPSISTRSVPATSVPATSVPTTTVSEAPSSVTPSSHGSPQVPTSIATQLMVNLSQPHLLPQVAALSVDGVGLLRSELMLQDILRESPQLWLSKHPDEELVEQLSQQIQLFAQAFAPRPIFYRSLDLRSHETGIDTSHALIEPNPTLGLHGALSYQTNPALFEIELAALRRVQHLGYDNLRLILPFVRTVEEFEFCRDRVIQAHLTQNSHFQLWIMAEVPSVLFLIPDYVKAGVQGISIGSNDLTQLLLAVDRDHPHMTAAFNQCHPAIVRAMQHLVQAARQAGIPCSICGQAPVQYPELIEQLVEWGMTAISVSPDAVDSTRRAIAQAEGKLLFNKMQSERTTQNVEKQR